MQENDSLLWSQTANGITAVSDSVSTNLSLNLFLLSINRMRSRRWKLRTTASSPAGMPRQQPRPSKQPGHPPRPPARPRPPRDSPWACPWTTSTSQTPSCQVSSLSPLVSADLKCLSRSASAACSFLFFFSQRGEGRKCWWGWGDWSRLEIKTSLLFLSHLFFYLTLQCSRITDILTLKSRTSIFQSSKR